jgi:hypothetical protein
VSGYNRLNDFEAPVKHPEPDCEAEERNRQAIYQMELDWGAGTFNYAKIKNILTGHDTTACAGHQEARNAA